MNLQECNLNTILPAYNDGKAKVFKIVHNELVKYPDEYLEDTHQEVFFQELSVTDNLKIMASERKINIVKKIRISQNKELSSANVLKIEGDYFSIYNSYDFTNKNGFLQTDLTLVPYDKEIKFRR